MKRLTYSGLLLLSLATLAHFLFAPVPIAPKAFVAPGNPGYTGVFAENTRLDPVRKLNLPSASGPEDGAVDASGRLYVSLRDGTIARQAVVGGALLPWVNTAGVPLGLDFDRSGTLWVADAYRGLLSIDRAGAVTVRCATVADTPIAYADDVVATDDGLIYFTDASTKFGAEENGGTFPASVLDMFEHGNYGRLIRFDSGSGQATVLRDGLAFANGVALSADQRTLYVVETGNNRILTLARKGEDAGTWGLLIDGLPGFPDNIETGREGRLWVGLVAPRNGLLDFSADKPFLRTLAYRLPQAIRPKAAAYGHLLALGPSGEVLEDLQTPAAYTHITGAVETPAALYITSLTESALGRLDSPPRLPD